MEQPTREDASVAWAALALGLAACASVIAIALLMQRRRAASVLLMEQGERARATVLKAWDTGARRHAQPVLGFVFEVRRPRLPPYQAEAHCAVPPALMQRVQPGATVPVRVDSNHPARVALDFRDA